MASVVLNGFIDNIHYLKNGAVVMQVSEFKKGYKHKDGRVIKDKYLIWRVMFSAGMRNYINNHFSNKMYVEIMGEIIPYALDGEDEISGYSLIGKALNLSSMPRLYAKKEQRMMKESQLHSTGVPNLEEYQQEDF